MMPVTNEYKISYKYQLKSVTAAPELKNIYAAKITLRLYLKQLARVIPNQQQS